jgi:hypothetical protein
LLNGTSYFAFRDSNGLASVRLTLGQKFRRGDDATREGWRYQHVQAIIVAIDQYAEAATGNHDFFLNKPPGAVGK